jgi:hypothetical protein
VDGDDAEDGRRRQSAIDYRNERTVTCTAEANRARMGEAGPFCDDIVMKRPVSRQGKSQHDGAETGAACEDSTRYETTGCHCPHPDTPNLSAL